MDNLHWNAVFNSGKPPSVLLLGKRRSLVLWLENLEASFVSLGYQTSVFAINGDGWISRLRSKIGYFDQRSPLMISSFEAALSRHRPDLVVVVGAFGIPIEYYELMRLRPRRPAVVGLVGDRFSLSECIERANLCDTIYLTDSYFLDESKRSGVRAHVAYLPLAVDPEKFRPGCGRRRAEPLLVASRTALRESIVQQLRKPGVIVGTDWSALKREGFHRVHNRKIGRDAVIRLYQSHRAVLNIRNEANVEYGLNQRSFEPMACGAVVLNDDLPDLARCFEPGKEILVYRDTDELNGLIDRVQSEPGLAERVASRGRARILAEHTFRHRIETIMKDLGL
jgi:spore maturation protein CgeB